MKTVFLDANILWSAAGNPAGTPWHLIWSGKADFISSHYAVAEARRNLPAERLPDLARLLERVRLVPDAFGSPPAGVKLPGKDIPILSSAAAAGADVLVTGDNHFEQYLGRSIGGVLIVLPRDLSILL